MESLNVQEGCLKPIEPIELIEPQTPNADEPKVVCIQTISKIEMRLDPKQ